MTKNKEKDSAFRKMGQMCAYKNISSRVHNRPDSGGVVQQDNNLKIKASVRTILYMCALTQVLISAALQQPSAGASRS